MLGDAFQERRWFEPVTVFVVESTHRVVDGLHPDEIGPKHWTTAKAGETVPVHPDDVDVTGTLGKTLFENLGALVNQWIHATLKNLLVTDLTSREPVLLRDLED